jgi:hypothetical protein
MESYNTGKKGIKITLKIHVKKNQSKQKIKNGEVWFETALNWSKTASLLF